MENFNWDEIFSKRPPSKYPYDNVIRFIKNNTPNLKSNSNIKILELGCGGGNNLWFAAKEKYKVYGIDSSKIAINESKKLFKSYNLNGEFYHGNFINLPYNFKFDLIIDRCSIACLDKTNANKVFSEVYRVLKSGGKFFLNTYSDEHPSFNRSLKFKKIQKGTLKGYDYLSFYNKAELLKIFKYPWNVNSLKKIKTEDYINNDFNHVEWELILEKLN